MGFGEGFSGGFSRGMSLRQAHVDAELRREELALRKAAEERLDRHYRALDEERTQENESRQQERRYKQLRDEAAPYKRLFELYPEPEAAPFMGSVERAIDASAAGETTMPRPEWMREEQPRPAPDFVGPMPEDTSPVPPEKVMSRGQQGALEHFKRAAGERRKWDLHYRQAGRAERPVIHDLQAMERNLNHMRAMADELESGATQSKFGFIYETMNPGDRKVRSQRLREQIRSLQAIHDYSFSKRHQGIPQIDPREYMATRAAQGATREQVAAELQAAGLLAP